MIKRILKDPIVIVLFVCMNARLLTSCGIKEVLLAYGITGLIVGGLIGGMKLLLED